jgi:hypothetical protein
MDRATTAIATPAKQLPMLTLLVANTISFVGSIMAAIRCSGSCFG